MEHGFYADTMRLFEQSIRIREQKRVAGMLYHRLCRARRITDGQDALTYERLAEQADRLVRYFADMETTVANMSVELEQLSLRIGEMLKGGGWE